MAARRAIQARAASRIRAMRVFAALVAVVLALALAACGGGDDGGDAGFPPRPPHTGNAPPASSILGTWSGLVKSADGASYTANMVVERAPGGTYRGKSVYPGLQCGGNLTGSQESPGVYRFTELITANKSLCGQDAWTITVDLLRPRAAQWRWAGPGSAFG